MLFIALARPTASLEIDAIPAVMMGMIDNPRPTLRIDIQSTICPFDVASVTPWIR